MTGARYLNHLSFGVYLFNPKYGQVWLNEDARKFRVIAEGVNTLNRSPPILVPLSSQPDLCNTDT